jgi:hypothetical protein
MIPGNDEVGRVTGGLVKKQMCALRMGWWLAEAFGCTTAGRFT